MKDVSFYDIVISENDQKIVSADSWIYDQLGSYAIKPRFQANYSTSSQSSANCAIYACMDNGNNTDTQTEHVEKVKDMLGKDRVLD